MNVEDTQMHSEGERYRDMDRQESVCYSVLILEKTCKVSI